MELTAQHGAAVFPHFDVEGQICGYPLAWLLLADLYEEVGSTNAAEMAMNAVDRFLESTPRDNGQLVGWERKVLLCRRSGDLHGAVHCLLQICELPKVGLNAISDAANTLNSIILNADLKLDWNEKAAVANRVIAAMKGYISEVDATDCSRLAWLYMRVGDLECARRLTQQGLALDPANEYCLRLAQRLAFIQQTASVILRAIEVHDITSVATSA